MSKNSKGFTIVELMFATVAFSAILLVAMTALIQIGRMYYKGVTTAQTQQAARSMTDQISQSIQFTGGSISAPRGIANNTPAPTGPEVGPSSQAIGFFCIGTTRYTYALDRQQSADAGAKNIKHAVWVDEPGICAGVSDDTVSNYYTAFRVDLTADVPSTYNGRDLLGNNMRLTKVSLVQPPGTTNGSLWQVALSVAYGDDDLLIVDPTNATRRMCIGGLQLGSQFCSTSELNIMVKRRVGVQ